jgi:hypothetical protein
MYFFNSKHNFDEILIAFQQQFIRILTKIEQQANDN